MLAYDEFSSKVAQLLQLEIEQPINPYDGLYDVIGIDSVQAFELLVIVESLANVDVPPAEIPGLFTMADVYEYYTGLANTEDDAS
jgi:acyl carrier protein